METGLTQGHAAYCRENARGQLCPWPAPKQKSCQFHSTQSSRTGFGDQELQLRKAHDSLGWGLRVLSRSSGLAGPLGTLAQCHLPGLDTRVSQGSPIFDASVISYWVCCPSNEHCQGPNLLTSKPDTNHHLLYPRSRKGTAPPGMISSTGPLIQPQEPHSVLKPKLD